MSNQKNPDFLYVDGKYTYSKEVYQKYNRILLKNQVSGHKGITRKDQLYENISKTLAGENYLLENYQIDLVKIDYNFIKKLFDSGKDWIFKPVGGFGGAGIETFERFDDFKNYTKLIMNRKDFGKRKESNLWVLQEYISNPLLYKGRKFHLRSYYLVHHDKYYFYNLSQVYTAEKEFKKKNYDDRKVHDTHIKGSIPGVYFPSSFNLKKKDIETIQGRIIDLFQRANNLSKTKCFDETKDCYELLGADLMITDKLEVKLLEINTKIGYKEFEGISFNYQLIENEMQTIVDKIFPPKNKIKPTEDRFFIPIY